MGFNTLKYVLFTIVYSCSFHNTYNKYIIHTHTPVFHLPKLLPANKKKHKSEELQIRAQKIIVVMAKAIALILFVWVLLVTTSSPGLVVLPPSNKVDNTCLLLKRYSKCAIFLLWLCVCVVCVLKVVAVTIIGGGSLTSVPLWNEWAFSYKFAQDTIDLQYTIINTQQALDSYRAGLIDFCSVDFSVPKETNLVQLPFITTAVAIIYRLDTLDPVNDSLVLDRPTLARMWGGSIVTWDDPAIAALNPELQGKLPHLNITFAIFPGSSLGQSEVLKRAFSSFSDEFKAQLEAAGHLLEGLPPYLQGRAKHGLTVEDRINLVKVLTSYLFLLVLAL